jgi:hypothetical protein
MTDGQLNANVEQYLQAATSNTPPPTILSDPVVPGLTPVEQWMAVLTEAANLSDAADNAQSTAEHAERDAKMREAAEKFAAQDELAAAELESIAAEPYSFTGGTAVAPEQTAAMAQQFPQLASGIAGALAGAVGGALQPLAQLPQQAAQGLQQAMQAGMGLLQQAGGGEAGLRPDDVDLATTPLAEDFGVDADDIAARGGAGDGALDLGSGGFGATGGGLGPLSVTAPTGYLGPPPVPPSSASTAPSSAPITSIAPAGNAVSHPPVGTGMAGMPLMPPGAMGAAASTDKDDKADTKRVSVPPVRNGAPVQGRLTVPPEAPPVTKKMDGKPVVARRIIGPNDSQSADIKSGS